MDTANERSKNTRGNYLEKDFQHIFSNVYRLQHIMGSCRVSIKNNLITAPTVLQKCYTILCMFLIFLSTYITAPALLEFMSDRSTITLAVMVMSSIYTASLCSLLHTRFVNGRENADFFIKIHNLDRFLKIEKRKSLNALLERINAFAVYTILITFTSLTVLGCVNLKAAVISTIGCTIFLVSFILEMVVCSGMVIFFFVRVRFVNSMIESYLQRDENVRKPIILSEPFKKIIRFVPADNDNYFATSEVHLYLKELFRCFTMFQNLYRFQLLVFCIKLVVISLMSFELMLYLAARNLSQISMSQMSVLLIFMLIDIFIAVFLAVRLGLFFSEVKETKRLCIAVMAVNHDGPMREKAKAMLNIIEEKPPRLSIYDMWDMNAGTFVSIFSLVTSLIVTLIQFTFL